MKARIQILIVTLIALALTARADWELYGPISSPGLGTYWSLSRGTSYPPLPCVPLVFVDSPIYGVVERPGDYVYDDRDNPSHDTFTANSYSSAESEPPPFPGDWSGDPIDRLPPDDRRALAKFAQQSFLLINTNLAASSDTNLYNACVTFPADTNTYPTLQIMPYQTNAVLIKANHFDYSAETSRDFALIVSDNVAAPMWKNIDFAGASDAEDGWLVQGIVPRFVVNDPMFMMVTNLYDRQAYFKAVPYDGPQVVLSGAQPYDTVSNTIVLHADISDLSGTTNSIFSFLVNGLPVPYILGTSNNITLDTRYAINGTDTITFKVLNHNATAFEPTNAPMDFPTVFDKITTLPLDFENGTYVYFQSDNASPSAGTNFMLYGVTPPVYIRAKIIEPSSGRVIRSLGGLNPSFDFVEIDWDFTDSMVQAHTRTTATPSRSARVTARAQLQCLKSRTRLNSTE